MSNSHRIFSAAVNDLLELLIKPCLEEERAELQKQGIPPAEIERLVTAVKIKTQAHMLPRIKELVKANLREIQAEQQENSASLSVKSRNTNK
jgi:hypothetical protein